MKLSQQSLIFVFVVLLADALGQGGLVGDELSNDILEEDDDANDELEMHPAVMNGTNVRYYSCSFCGGYTPMHCRSRCKSIGYKCYACEECDCNCHFSCFSIG
ncbi:uncharacterized protein LOC118439113 [Folsomia candida]|nr:uncharacterized protein LOC118439113 [Folsomia candida]